MLHVYAGSSKTDHVLSMFFNKVGLSSSLMSPVSWSGYERFVWRILLASYSQPSQDKMPFLEVFYDVKFQKKNHSKYN